MKKTLIAAIGGILLSASLTAAAQVVVRVGPPRARYERIPPPPPEHRDWAWHNGYHRWDGQRYVWVPGVYEAPPRPHARWVPGHWNRRGGGYLWVEGHWR